MNDKGAATPGGGGGATCIDLLCAPFPLRHLLDCADRPHATLILESVPFVLSRFWLQFQICQGTVTGLLANLSTLPVQELVLAGVKRALTISRCSFTSSGSHTAHHPDNGPGSWHTAMCDASPSTLAPHVPPRVARDSYNIACFQWDPPGSAIKSLLLPMATHWRGILAGISPVRLAMGVTTA